MRRLAAINRTNGSYKQMLEQLRDIGEEAFSTGRHLKTPPKQEIMRDLYFSIRDALTETADFVDPRIGDQLRKNNKIATDLMGEKSILAQKLRNPKTADETIFKSVIQSGDTKQLNALKTFLTPDEWDAVKGSYMASLMKSNIGGDVGAGTIFNKIRDAKPRINAMFNEGELDNFVGLLKLKDRVGAPFLSSSGTGAANLFGDFRKSASRAADAGVAKMIETKKPAPKKVPGKLKRAARAVAKKSRRPALKASQVYSVQQQNGGE